MASWQYAVGDWGALGPDVALTAARSRRVTFRLRAPSEASFTLDGDNPQATEITELVTDLHIYRDGERLYRGRVGATRDTADADRHTVDVQTADYRALLLRRILYDSDQLSWVATDQADIALELIGETQSRIHGDLGITEGVGNPTGVTRDRNYEPGKPIGEAIQELSEVIDGFDWDINPDTKALDIYYPERGTDNGVVLDYGGLVTGFTRAVDPSRYANAVRLNGDELLLAESREAADLGSRAEGRWDAQHGYTTITDQGTLDDRADWHIEQDQLLVPAYTLRLRAGRWEGPDHIWLGDPCQVVLRAGRLEVDTVQRVWEIAVSLGDSGEEDVQVTLAGPAPDFRRKVTDQLVRLDQLERR